MPPLLPRPKAPTLLPVTLPSSTAGASHDIRLQPVHCRNCSGWYAFQPPAGRRRGVVVCPLCSARGALLRAAARRRKRKQAERMRRARAAAKRQQQSSASNPEE
jgi:uncharacterized Zn finger protein (UPF0148 family)